MSFWELAYGGVQKSFADWGLKGLQRERRSQQADAVRFVADGRRVDAGNLFDYGASAVIYRDGSGWFTGTFCSLPRMGSPQGESHSYEMAGPWWHLEDRIYHVSRTFYDPTTFASGSWSSSQAILGLRGDGTRRKTGEQICDVLDWCLSLFPVGSKPFQYASGNVLPVGSIYVPYNEVNDKTCAECIRLMLRWHPGAVTWFDYTTDPPTFYCSDQASLAGVSLGFPQPGNGIILNSLQMVPRHDLVREAIILRYSWHGSHNGEDLYYYAEDKWPDGVHPAYAGGPTPAAADDSSPTPLAMTISLAGPKVISASQALSSVDVYSSGWAASAQLRWWYDHCVDLRSDRIANISINGSKFTRIINGSYDESGNPEPGTLDYELVDGAVAEWMTGYTTAEEVFAVEAAWDEYDTSGNASLAGSGGLLRRTPAHVIACVIRTTDAPTDVYNTATVESEGDPMPPSGVSGLANYLYDCYRVLHWAGSLSVIENECSDTYRVGKVLNITGGNASWASMSAIIQTQSEDIDNRTTQIGFGPAEHLDVQDLIAVYRTNRTRLRYTALGDYQTGKGGGGGAITLPRYTPTQDGVRGAKTVNYQVFYQASAPSGASGCTNVGKITLDSGVINPSYGAQIRMEATSGATGVTGGTTGKFGTIDLSLISCVTPTAHGSVAKVISVQEIEVCYNGMSGYYILVPRSNVYTTGGVDV